MKSYLSYSLIFVACATISCSPYHRLLEDFNGRKSSIKYLYTSKIVEIKKNINVSIPKPALTDSKFERGRVRQLKSEVIPLLVFNAWDHINDCSIGKSQIQENVNDFIRTALVEESNRSGIYRADTSSNHLYTLEIEVDSLRAGGTQRTKGFFAYFFFIYVHENSVQATSVPAYCRIRYQLKKGDETLISDHVSTTAQLEFLTPHPLTPKTINNYFKTHLVELLGETFKTNIERIVQVVNQKLTSETQEPRLK